MKKHKLYITGLLLTALVGGSCTKLDEHVYDKVDASGFLTRRDDVIRDFLRPFEHGYWSIQGNDVYAVGETVQMRLVPITARATGRMGDITSVCTITPGR